MSDTYLGICSYCGNDGDLCDGNDPAICPGCLEELRLQEQDALKDLKREYQRSQSIG